MGASLGVIKAPTLGFDLAQLFPLEVRVYEPYFVAEIECDDAHLREASTKLARYFGLHGIPENVKGISFQLVTNVCCFVLKLDEFRRQHEYGGRTSEKMEMTYPVIREDDVLQFILPSSYKDIASIPIPTDSAIVIRSVPQRVVAVKGFRGKGSRKQYMRKIHQLQLLLAEDSLLASSVAAADDAVHWSVAQYQPHATLSLFRKNEVWIDLDMALPAVEALLAKKSLPKRKIEVKLEEEGKAEGVGVGVGEGSKAARFGFECICVQHSQPYCLCLATDDEYVC